MKKNINPAVEVEVFGALRELYEDMKKEYSNLQASSGYPEGKLAGYHDCLWDTHIILGDFGIKVIMPEEKYLNKQP